MKIAFLGLGIMGSRMAANLLEKGHEVTVWNRSAQPALDLGAKGATVGESPSACVEGAQAVVTMLAKPEAVEAVAFGEGGFFPALPEGALWVDSSTVNPSYALSCHERAEAKGVRFLDAPVAGTKPQAQAGELAFFVGGAEADAAEAAPYFEATGKKTIHVGPKGKGAAFKMLVNALLAQAMLAFSEALLLGERMGLSRDFLLDALPGLPVSAPFLQMKAGMLRSEEYETQFPLELMHKDLHLFALTGYEHGLPLPSANAAKEVYAQAAQGFAREDFAAVYAFLAGKEG